MKVWREGSRVRDDTGRGYGDRISDARLLDIQRGAEFRALAARGAADFAAAVLAFRARERAALAGDADSLSTLPPPGSDDAT